MYRALVSVAVLSLAACALTGCPDDDNKAKPSDNSKKATKENSKAAKEKPSAEAAPSAKEKAGGAEPKMGTATIKGVVSFTGKPVEMKTPAKRKDAEFCKDKDVKYNAVAVK